MKKILLIYGMILIFNNILWSLDIKNMLVNADNHLNNLEVLGNSNLDNARIIFLPEIHDDPHSLIIQLLLIAKEKQKQKPFLILDESLKSMKQSKWDIFSQKYLEIIVAKESKEKGMIYSSDNFTKSLNAKAKEYQANKDGIHFDFKRKIWILNDFKDWATTFLGWDLTHDKHNLLNRNQAMINTIKEALTKYNRIFVMAGARHIPELENYLYSINTLSSKHRTTKDLELFLQHQEYAVAFDKSLYSSLKEIGPGKPRPQSGSIKAAYKGPKDP